MRTLTLILTTFLFIGTSSAQEFSFGFKAGLNFSKIDGELETNSSDSNLEEANLSKGFHFGPIFNLKLTDAFTVRGELLYSQKGTDYNYNGQSFWLFYPQNGDPILHNGGNRNMRLFVSNSYLDIPILAVLRLGRIELSGGVNAALLISSKATGELTYAAANIDPFTTSLEYNFRKDVPTTDAGTDPFLRAVNNTDVTVPKETGAYYGSFGRSDKLYNSFDLGLNAGIAFYLSEGLFVSFRMNYGLLDITKEEQDFSASRLSDDNTFIMRNDIDKNVSLQASVGFSF